MNTRKTFALGALLLICSAALFAQTPPAHITVPPGMIAVFSLQAQDDAGTARAVTGATVTVDDTVYAYAAQAPASGAIIFYAKGTPPAGTTKTVTLTVNATNDRGDPVTPMVMLFDIPGPALPPPATHVAIKDAINVRDTIGVNMPADPHAATVAVVF